MPARSARATGPALLGAASAAAWLVLWRAHDSPWGTWLHAHGTAPHHGVDPLDVPRLGALFLGGWLMMTVAMMLPSTAPLVDVFRRLVAPRRDAGPLVAWLLLGYLAAWTICGAAVLAAVLALTASPAAGDWLATHPRAGPAALFLVAGLFQFSRLKHQCLDRCRTPFGFVAARWRGGRPHWRAFRLGVDHGAFCVGCCWALMLLMFAVGTFSLPWMLLLGAIMTAEKSAVVGVPLTRPLGAVLVATSLAVAIWPA